MNALTLNIVVLVLYIAVIMAITVYLAQIKAKPQTNFYSPAGGVGG